MRGLFPEDLNPANVPLVAHAFSRSLKAGPVALAHDNRPTTEAMVNLVSAALLASGREVHLLGLVPTPTIKAYVAEKKLPGGIMLSASHNPETYNAFKFIGNKGFFFSNKDNEKLKKALKETPQFSPAHRQGKSIDAHEAAIDIHLNSVLDAVFEGDDPAHYVGKSDITALIDPVGSCATYISQRLAERLGIETHYIHKEYHGKFPRKPEPVPAALKKAGVAVKETKAHLGLAFDPDADRLALIDAGGAPLGEEYTLALSLQAAMATTPGVSVINLSTSWLNEYIAGKAGSRIYRSLVGEANVVTEMIKRKAVFGGEGNGGVIDPRINSFGRDSLAAMAHIIKLMVSSNKSLAELKKELPPVAMYKSTLTSITDTRMQRMYKQLANTFSDYESDTRDGLRMAHKTGLPWIHLRPSNTEPIVRLMIEAESLKQAKELAKQSGLEEKFYKKQ